jgi:hypothetical protein
MKLRLPDLPIEALIFLAGICYVVLMLALILTFRR